jgi:hypothetical protein
MNSTPENRRCLVCRQRISRRRALKSFYHALLEGAVRYSICPACMQEVAKPWSKAYRARFRSKVKELMKEHRQAPGHDDMHRD